MWERGGKPIDTNELGIKMSAPSKGGPRSKSISILRGNKRENIRK